MEKEHDILFKIDESNAKFELLKGISFKKTSKEILQLASTLRDNLMSDNDISKGCLVNEEARTKRSMLINEINSFIKSTIISSIELEDAIICSPEISINYDVAKSSLIDILNEEREETSTLISNSKDIFEMCPGIIQYKDLVLNILNKCEEDRYTILFVGEYQSGKTTTTNAICGGYEIGAIGKGTKTSSVPLSVHYSTNETVEIVWKSVDEIKDIIKHLKSQWFGLSADKFQLLITHIEDNPKYRALLLDKLELIRKNTKDLSNTELEEKDKQFVVLASFILRYWSNFFDKNQRDVNVHISNLSAFTRFPKHMIKRWWENGVADFTAEEVAFAFIREIRIGFPSIPLDQLKGEIMDCPGLFASEYDSLVTEQAMKKADAILYIFPVGKQIGDMMNVNLKTLKSRYPHFKSKLFFANNLSLIDPNKLTIYTENLDIAKRIFGQDTVVSPYDALRAYLGQIRLSYDQGCLDDKTINKFIAESQPPKSEGFDDFLFFGNTKNYATFVDAWDARVKLCNAGQILSGKDLLESSQMVPLIERIKAFVQKNKAYSIIVANGVDVLRKQIDSMCFNLICNYIEPYNEGKDKLSKLWQDRVSYIESFEKSSIKKLREKLLSDQFLTSLTDTVFSNLFSEIEFSDLTSNICDSIYSNASELHSLRKDKKEQEKKVASIVANCVSSLINRKLEYWRDLMDSNKDGNFNSVFIENLTPIRDEINSSWISMFKGDKLFIERRDYFFPIPSRVVNTSKGSVETIDNQLSISSSTISNVAVMDKAAMATFILGFAAYYIGILLGGPIAWILSLIGGGGLGAWISSKAENRFKKKARPEIEKVVNDKVFRNKIKSVVSAEINRVITGYVNNILINKAALIAERDTALATVNNPDAESLCFSAVDIISKLRDKKCKLNNFICNIVQ